MFLPLACCQSRLLTQCRLLLILLLVLLLFLSPLGGTGVGVAPAAEPWWDWIGACQISSQSGLPCCWKSPAVAARQEKRTARDREDGTGTLPAWICLNCHDGSLQRLFCLSSSQVAMSGSQQQKHAAFSLLTVLFSFLLCTYVLFPLKLSGSPK